jgi:DMSO/TMAO reductase YedYZ molybdopterin-dependent catalytic subunit
MVSMTRFDTPGMTPSGPPRGTNRRRFILASGAAAGLAAAAGVGGQYLKDHRSAGGPATASAATAPPASGSGSGSGSGSASSVKIGGPGVEEEVLPKGADITDIPDLTTFYTPTSKFYRVDTTLTVPKVSAQTWELRIHGMVDKPITISFADLMKRPMIGHDVTITCVSESVGGSLMGNARWQGTLLAPILREAGIHPDATQIVMRDVQGMALGVATKPVMDGRKSMLAIGMNGQVLPAEHGYPVRVIVPGIYGYVSACKWVVDMELTTFAAYNAYWTHRGWSQQAPIKTESRIDTPKDGGKPAAGQVMIAGVAWAQNLGIETVEVGIDDTWHQATLAVQEGTDTWRQWYYPWQATSGTHKLQVRATDKHGYTQTSKIHHTLPNGATGYHTINVTVA